MPRYHIDIPKSAKKSLAKIPLPWLFRVQQAIDRLELEPYLGDKMQGKYSDRRKLKVWPYRVIYKIQEEINYIKIMEIAPRGHTSYD